MFVMGKHRFRLAMLSGDSSNVGGSNKAVTKFVEVAMRQ